MAYTKGNGIDTLLHKIYILNFLNLNRLYNVELEFCIKVVLVIFSYACSYRRSNTILIHRCDQNTGFQLSLA